MSVLEVHYDFEFRDKYLAPISLGMVTNTKKELYIINSDFPEVFWSDWLNQNVRPALRSSLTPEYEIHEMAEKDMGAFVYSWLKSFDCENIELIGYYADYDHVIFSRLFGEMIDLPRGLPMWSRDIKQWIKDCRNPKIPFAAEIEHHALADARHNKRMHQWLKNNFDHPAWTGDRDPLLYRIVEEAFKHPNLQ